MPTILRPDQLASPRLRQAYAYWDGKRAGRPMPSRRDIDPSEIPALLPYVMLVEVLAGPPRDYRYRLVGTEVRNISHRDNTGARMSQLAGKGPGSIVWDNCEQVVATKAPFSRRPPYVGPDAHLRNCENLLMPLSADGVAVTMIFHVISFERGPGAPAPRSGLRPAGRP